MLYIISTLYQIFRMGNALERTIIYLRKFNTLCYRKPEIITKNIIPLFWNAFNCVDCTLNALNAQLLNLMPKKYNGTFRRKTGIFWLLRGENGRDFPKFEPATMVAGGIVYSFCGMINCIRKYCLANSPLFFSAKGWKGEHHLDRKRGYTASSSYDLVLALHSTVRRGILLTVQTKSSYFRNGW